MGQDWVVLDRDRQVAVELRRRVPAAIFDAHVHLYRRDDGQGGDLVRSGPALADRSVWLRELGHLVGTERLRGGLMIPMPGLEDPGACTEWLLGDAGLTSADRALVLAWPGMSRERLDEWFEHDAVVGIKPYHFFGGGGHTFELPVEAYCPEWMWAVCHERRALITLHLVRSMALADPGNLGFLLHCCERYPGVKLILAHAGRGFHAPNTVSACSELAHLDNVWFDSSAICESAALAAIIEHFGPTRLLWGSDFPVSQKRGTCVTVGDDFAWIDPGRIDAPDSAPACHPWPVALESLRALLDAADQCGLNGSDLEDLFGLNAHRLLGLATPSREDVQALYRRARKRIPGGTQLLSKRPEMLAPEQWPAYFSEARGCRVRDTDGRSYIDFSYNGIGSCLLGFRDPDVTRAVHRRLHLGSMCTQNPAEELELADLLCALHPWADMARFARTGGETAAIAVRIARATTGRTKVAVCGYHGWHDWYLAANLGEDDALRGHLLPGLQPDGVPAELRGTTLTFAYNDRDAFEAVLATAGDELACVVMEPARHHPPEPGFIERIREATAKRGILLLFDEITIGFRLCVGGAHMHLGFEPDMAFFAKALGNGHPIGAVIGTRAAMEGAHNSFISSTYWTEGIGPAAALAALDKMQRVDLPAHLAWAGTRVKGIWRRRAEEAALPISVEGVFPCMAHLSFATPEAEALRTLYTQEMLKLGFLAGAGYYPTLAHTEPDMSRFEQAVAEVFGRLGTWRRADCLRDRLEGPVAHSGFRRLAR